MKRSAWELIVMRSIKAVYDNGHLTLDGGSSPSGRMEVVVIFPGQEESIRPHDKDAGKRFVREWGGILEGCDVRGWKDRKAEHPRFPA
jgi:hypothetical protein